VSNNIDQIDQEIKELIYTLNELEGIQTLQSCSGHSSDIWSYVEGYVAFIAETQDDLRNLLVRLPFERSQINVTQNAYLVQRLNCSCGYDQTMCPNQIVYNLAFGGQPIFYQRKLIVDLTHALKKPRLPEKRISSTIHDVSHILDISPRPHPNRYFQNSPYLRHALWTQVCLFLDTLSLFVPFHHLKHILSSLYHRTTPKGKRTLAFNGSCEISRTTRVPLLFLPHSPKSKTSTEMGSSPVTTIPVAVFLCIVPTALLLSLKHSTLMLLRQQQKKPRVY